MAQYYSTRPTAAKTNTPAEDNNHSAEAVSHLSEYDKHHERLLSDDVDKGWASELRQYLGTMQRDVKKDTDIVEWWQVRNKLHMYTHYLLIRFTVESCTPLSDTCTDCPRCSSITGLICALREVVLSHQTNCN